MSCMVAISSFGVVRSACGCFALRRGMVSPATRSKPGASTVTRSVLYVFASGVNVLRSTFGIGMMTDVGGTRADDKMEATTADSTSAQRAEAALAERGRARTGGDESLFLGQASRGVWRCRR